MKKIIAICLFWVLLTSIVSNAVEITAGTQEKYKLEKYENEELMRKRGFTDRFIVKYRGLKPKKADEKIEQAYNRAIAQKEIQEISENDDNIIKHNNMEKYRKDSFKIRVKNDDENKLKKYIENTEVISLNEEVDPTVFVDDILEELNADIEYIQPDYLLELASEEIIIEPEVETISNTEVADTAETNLIKDSMTENEEISVVEIEESTEDLIAENNTDSNNSAIVAVIDTGIDITNEVFAGKTVSGYDFVNNTENVYNEELGMEQAHGTHVAGLIAQTANNVKIMPLKVFENGKAYTSDIIEAIEFAQDNGATIVNCSWGSSDNNPILKETIENSDMLFVCAAGNNRINLNKTEIYPGCFNLENIINVACINDDYGISYFSNYSSTYVDIAAKGRNVTSIAPGGETIVMSGTSMSAALVSAAAAKINEENIAETLKASADKVDFLSNKVSGGRVLNLENITSGIDGTILDIEKPEDEYKPYNVESEQESWELFNNLENVQVVAGYDASYVLKSDGSVWAWGGNSVGQLGIGSYGSYNYPVMVSIENVEKIYSNFRTVYAIKSDGTLWGWGDNSSGQLGDGTTTSRTMPIQVLNISNVTDVAGSYHTIACTSDGSVYTWGDNYYGEMGTGTTSSTIVTTPTLLTAITGVISVAANYSYCVALTDSGNVYTWGFNSSGQLGNGTTTDVYYPVQVAGISLIQEIEAGDSHVLALTNNGIVYAWGSNWSGQLGNNTTTGSTSPIQITSLGTISEIFAGGSSSAAITNQNSLYVWGGNSYGQLGDNYIDKLAPQLSSVSNSALNVGISSYHVLVLQTNGTIYSAGCNGDGQLGNGTSMMQTNFKLLNLRNVEQISSGENSSFAIKDGQLLACGSGYWGEEQETIESQWKNINISNVKQAFTNWYFNIVLKNDGTVWTWGNNNNGQLGDGTTTNITTPTCVTTLSDIVKVAQGYWSSVALKSDGTVWTWGDNSKGQLGNGTTTDCTVPQQITGITDVVDVVAGWYHVYAIKSDGSVWAWGENDYGELGIGTTANSSVPVQINGLSDITKISSGSSYAMALKSDGTVYAWGGNYVYQLGDGTSTKKTTPQVVGGLQNVVDIAAGNASAFAVCSDGSLYVWGSNQNGQLGNGTFTNITTPTKNNTISNAEHVFAGNTAFSAFVIDNSGNLYACGKNDYAQLGNGFEYATYIPQRVKGISSNGSSDEVSHSFTVSAGNNYLIPVSVYNFSDFGRNFHLLYDTSVFDIVNVSLQNSRPIKTIGTYDKINVISVSNGDIEFEFTHNIGEGNAWNGLLNIIELKAKTNGETTVVCYSE